MNPDQPMLVCPACAGRHVRRSDDYLARLMVCRNENPTHQETSTRAELRMQATVVSSALGFAAIGLSVLEQMRF